MSIHEIGYVYDCDLDINWVLRGLIELFELIELWFEVTFGTVTWGGSSGCVFRRIVAMYVYN